MAKKPTTTEQQSLERIELETEAAEMLAREEQQEAEHADGKEKAVSQKEREALMADAYMLTGRAQAFSAFAKFGDISTLLTLKQIKDNKAYKHMQGIGTWENYCQLLGFSRRHIDEQLDNLNTLGQNLLETVSSFGIGYKELRQLRSATASGDLSITDSGIVIEGTAIPLDDKDELKEALENLIASKDKKIHEHENTLKAKDKIIKAKEETINKQAKELTALEGRAEAMGLTADESKFIRNIQNIKISVLGEFAKLHPSLLPPMTEAMRKEYVIVIKSLHEDTNGLLDMAGEYDDETPALDEDEHIPLPCHTCAKGATCNRTHFYSNGFNKYDCDEKE